MDLRKRAAGNTPAHEYFCSGFNSAAAWNFAVWLSLCSQQTEAVVIFSAYWSENLSISNCRQKPAIRLSVYTWVWVTTISQDTLVIITHRNYQSMIWDPFLPFFNFIRNQSYSAIFLIYTIINYTLYPPRSAVLSFLKS